MTRSETMRSTAYSIASDSLTFAFKVQDATTERLKLGRKAVTKTVPSQSDHKRSDDPRCPSAP